MFSEQTPPHSLEAEQAIIGACLLSPLGLTSCLQALTPADFYSRNHATIFGAIQDADKVGPVDAVTVHARLTELGQAETVGGLSYLFQCGDMCPTPNVPEGYIEAVRSKAVRRRLITACQRGIDEARDELRPLDELQARLEGLVLGARDTVADEVDPVQWAHDVETEAALVEAGQDGRPRVRTGYDAIDDYLFLRPGRLTVLAGGTSQGKSVLAAAIAANSSLRLGQRTYVWSGEMDRREWWERLAAAELQIPYTDIQNRVLNHSQRQAIKHLSETVKASPLIIRDKPMSAADIRADCRYIAHTRGKVDLVIIDYLSLLTDLNRETEGSDRRDVRMGIIVWQCIQLAKELEAHVILLHQLNREKDRRQTARPRLSDLKDSSTIEQHAHSVVLVYRGDRDEALTDEEREAHKGALEVIIAKQRSGIVGSMFLGFLGEFQRLTNLHRSRWPGRQPPPARQPVIRGGKKDAS